MKVLLIARSFSRGGAATGAANLAAALETQVPARIPTLYRRDTDAIPTWSFRGLSRIAERVVERALFDAETHCLRLGPPCIELLETVRALDPDIVQLCDISASTIRPRDLLECPVPVVHRMSDFWPYHGPQHYGLTPDSAPASARKMFEFSGFSLPHHVPVTRVAPSAWLAENARGAPTPVVIPNAVRSPPGLTARAAPRSPIRLGFIAGKLSDPRKGYARLVQALSALEGPAELHTWGRVDGALPKAPVPASHHGPFLKTSVSKVLSEIDILLCPSVLDNSPNAATEALAHGVPVVGQRGTGLETYLDDARGALVDFDGPPDAVAGALDSLVANYATASRAALTFARDRLSPEAVGRSYFKLYQVITSGS